VALLLASLVDPSPLMAYSFSAGLAGDMHARQLMKKGLLGLFGTLGRWVPRNGWPILTYHSIDEAGTAVSTPRWQFEAQMIYLRDRGHQVSSLRPLLDYLRNGTAIPDHTVFLTFDDGVESTYSEAFPVLQGLGFQATVFLASGCVGQKAEWYVDAGIPAQRMLNWEQIGEMLAGGIDFQAHSCSHPHLTRIDPEVAEREIRQSREVIEEKTGRSVGLFAYPFGEYNLALARLVEHIGLIGAVTTDVGLFRPAMDPYQIKRMGLNYLTVSSNREAALLMDACVGGTFAWYHRFSRLAVRQRKDFVARG